MLSTNKKNNITKLLTKEDKKNFNLLFNDLYHCIEHVKIWLVISRAAEKYGFLKHENFFGWIQVGSCVPAIIIGCKKITSGEYKNYINKILKEKIENNNIYNLFFL